MPENLIRKERIARRTRHDASTRDDLAGWHGCRRMQRCLGLAVAMLAQYVKEPGLVPILAAALFSAHPLHTGAVANIKGRDEILSPLFFVLTAMVLDRYATRRSVPELLLGCAVASVPGAPGV